MRGSVRRREGGRDGERERGREGGRERASERAKERERERERERGWREIVALSAVGRRSWGGVKSIV